MNSAHILLYTSVKEEGGEKKVAVVVRGGEGGEGGCSLVRRLPFLALQSKQPHWHTMALSSPHTAAPARRTGLQSEENNASL